MILKSKNFILRPCKKSDAESIVCQVDDKIIFRNTSRLPFPYTIKEAKKWIGENMGNKKKDRISFVIDVGGKFVGNISLSSISKEHKAEIGYLLGRDFWGKGIMTEAVKLVTKYGFQKLKLKRIFAHVFLFNSASKKVLEKAGYKLEGISKKEVKKGNKYLDVYLLAKVR